MDRAEGLCVGAASYQVRRCSLSGVEPRSSCPFHKLESQFLPFTFLTGTRTVEIYGAAKSLKILELSLAFLAPAMDI